ncbi:MAG: Hsp20/alpha crystallin family protein [Candidatus Pedobacter colombiensis]|uniref:Hsp20/alpha crystallin family protein n=1 Tax=Candidatus Pedobacter colombiensis TaxID=3121371 RepID=A0AAJ5WDG0_9SPHI|nr:Hsp20/alpha crystallin family protein [Pedobacter sp.]WEK21434.1 MAG: Hsp20/alpha crystallin family protein [Pedobacter sp.]
MALVKFNEKNNRDLMAPGFNNIFESFFNDSFISDRLTSRVPAVNISETDDQYHIELAAPGLKKDDFKVSLDNDVLTISVEKKSEHTETNKRYNRREYSYSSFVRSFSLPDTADDGKIEASYTDGVLTINAAKREESKRKSREISIK